MHFVAAHGGLVGNGNASAAIPKPRDLVKA